MAYWKSMRTCEHDTLLLFFNPSDLDPIKQWVRSQEWWSFHSSCVHVCVYPLSASLTSRCEGEFGACSHQLDPIKSKWQTNAAHMVICLQQEYNALTASWGILLRWDHWTDSWLEAGVGGCGCRLNATCGLQTVWFWYSSLSLLSLVKFKTDF